MKNLIISVILLFSNIIFASSSCNLCIYIEPDMSLLHIEIDPLQSCEYSSLKKGMSCDEYVFSIGSDDISGTATVDGKDVPVKYVYEVPVNQHLEFEKYFLHLKKSNPKLSVKIDSNRIYSTFSVTFKK